MKSLIMKRAGTLLRHTLCAAAAVLSGAVSMHAIAADAPKLDISGVWLPNSRESGRWPAQPPFTENMIAARARWARNYEPIDLTRDDEHISCLPYTLPNIMLTITQYPFEIVTTPTQVLLLTEVYGQVRRIHLDSPPQTDRLPTHTGYSRGRWEGSQLVVETTHILPQHEGTRYASSPSMRMTERLSVEPDERYGKRLINEVTIEDPLVYSKPVTVRMVYRWARDVEVAEYICEQDLWDQHRDGSDSKIPWR